MAGPGDELAGGAGGRGRLRASHSDREQVIGTLKAAFVAGMLAKDEFDLRVGQALASRTYAELSVLTADLPAGLAAAPPAEPAWAGSGQPAVRPGQLIKWATGLYAGLWAGALLSPNLGDNPVAGPLVFVGTLIYLGVLVIAAMVAAGNRQARRPGGELPRGQAPGAGGAAVRRPPPAGTGGQLPPAGPGHRHAAEAGRGRRSRPSLPVRGPCADGALAAGAAPADG
jgi:Domain of unknown function (DUF1707)